MHVVLVSLCEKKAWKRTRAILDSYALRFGERTWMSPMTMEGVRELRSVLRRTATRQTSVACFQNVGRSKMALLWVVGNRKGFGKDGISPIAVRKSKEKTDFPAWARTASLLSGTAGLMHDLGKFGDAFQEKLKESKPIADPVRHEWLSLILARTFFETPLPDSWDTFAPLWDPAWNALRETPETDRYEALSPFLGPLMKREEALLYLIATHHRLPSGQTGILNAKNHVSDPRCEIVPVSTPTSNVFEEIRDGLFRLQSLPDDPGQSDPLYWKSLTWISRMALILADHSVSSREPSLDEMSSFLEENPTPAYANTKVSGKKRVFNQELNWHLLEVGRVAQEMVFRILSLSPPSLSPESVERIRTPAGGRYQWQNTADRVLSESSGKNNVPHLVFNMAGTGSGKTRMNARAICALRSDSEPLRLATALNLRTLTLQTGHAYREQLGIGSDEMSCVIGDLLVQKLFERAQEERQEKNTKEDKGKKEEDEDGNDLEEELDIDAGFEWSDCPAWLEGFLARTPKTRSVIGSPVLVSTIDFLIDAGDPRRQGRHALAMLRLMTSDLILDEIDSYDPEPLMAVLRLVWLAGLFGRNLVVSSATLSRPVARMVWASFASGVRAKGLLEGKETSFVSVLIDDLVTPSVIPGGTEDDFMTHYENHLTSMFEKLDGRPAQRAFLQKIVRKETEPPIQSFVSALREGIGSLHAKHHIVDPETGKNMSFGLIRIANIPQAIEVASSLAKKMPRSALVACYHSQLPMIARWHLESRLDTFLDRRNGDHHIFSDPEIRKILDKCPKDQNNLVFIVVATPVEEIGRDHDFDWALIEPSSTQSIVQTAGRVNRHRRKTIKTPNVGILQFNIKEMTKTKGGKAVFTRPGLERKPYSSHDLEALLDWAWLADHPLDARLRFDPRHRFQVEDDRSLEAQTANNFRVITEGVIKDSEGKFLMDWMSKNYYEEMSLRNHEERKMEFFLPDPEKEPRKIIAIEEGILSLGKCDRTVPLNPEKHRENTWLVLRGREMVEKVKEVGIDLERGTKVQVRVFEKSKIYRDPDFGFWLLKNAF